jgi:hypothetical protein
MAYLDIAFATAPPKSSDTPGLASSPGLALQQEASTAPSSKRTLGLVMLFLRVGLWALTADLNHLDWNQVKLH